MFLKEIKPKQQLTKNFVQNKLKKAFRAKHAKRTHLKCTIKLHFNTFSD